MVELPAQTEGTREKKFQKFTLLAHQNMDEAVN
jgi:hypothetical protein